MQTNEAIKVSPEQQAEREKDCQRGALRRHIAELAQEKWLEEQGVGVDVDTEARTVTVYIEDYDIHTTYRYGFDVYGGVTLWNEEEGEGTPDELADDTE